MNNSNKGEFYFGITDTQIYICFFEEGKNEFEQTLDFEIPDNLSNKLNFKIVQNLLKENIRKLEKDLGFFLNSGNISIKSKSYLRFAKLFNAFIYFGFISRALFK